MAVGALLPSTPAAVTSFPNVTAESAVVVVRLHAATRNKSGTAKHTRNMNRRLSGAFGLNGDILMFGNNLSHLPSSANASVDAQGFTTCHSELLKCGSWALQ